MIQVDCRIDPALDHRPGGIRNECRARQAWPRGVAVDPSSGEVIPCSLLVRLEGQPLLCAGSHASSNSWRVMLIGASGFGLGSIGTPNTWAIRRNGENPLSAVRAARAPKGMSSAARDNAAGGGMQPANPAKTTLITRSNRCRLLMSAAGAPGNRRSGRLSPGGEDWISTSRSHPPRQQNCQGQTKEDVLGNMGSTGGNGGSRHPPEARPEASKKRRGVENAEAPGLYPKSGEHGTGHAVQEGQASPLRESDRTSSAT